VESGFNAFGVDINETYLMNGKRLFNQRGYDTEKRLLSTSRVSSFNDAFFDIVFSEQVLEHVLDLESVIHEMGRLTKIGGVGIHRFPGRFCVNEPHLHVPFVHWLPKTIIRKYYLKAAFSFIREPDGWFVNADVPYGSRVETYYRYLHEKVYYRSTEEICYLFEKYNFVIESVHLFEHPARSLLEKNGFPRDNVTLYVKKK
jgi:ubiquinone/menaquinone biosynthesis C-methylase UbiE